YPVILSRLPLFNPARIGLRAFFSGGKAWSGVYLIARTFSRASMTLEPGQLIEGKYRIVRLIGEGGMGSVFEGENVRINRRLAIKVLHSAFTENGEVVSRFEREAQAAGRIGNDHILEVLDIGALPDGDRFIVMEYLDGDP